MAHEILGSRFISRVQSAWHNIAQRIFSEDEVLTARAAMAEVAGDIEVIRAPLSYEIDGVRYSADEKMAIVRKATKDDPTARMLGIAEDSWVADSYAELAAPLDALVGKGYKVETAGVLQKGGLAFLCFRADDWAVKGDAMRSYFAANFSLTPGKGHKVFHLAARLVAQFHEMKDKAKAIFEAFAERPVTAAEVDAIVFAAFQLPSLPPKIRLLKQTLSDTEAETFKKALTPQMLIDLQKAEESYDRQVDTVNKLRATARERFEAFEPANLRGTAWAAYNAVTEVADWREGRGADEAALFGSRAKEKSRAYAAAMELVVKG